jgi:mono/diheme cytochrome c family protein
MRGYVISLCAAGLLGAAFTASAADPQAGKTLVDQSCAACHGGMMSMWKGKSQADIDALIHKVVAGSVPHPKKLELTDAQIADVAAYWASTGK